MNKLIQNIISKNCKNEEKYKELESLEDEIKIAKGILSGKFKYCPKCDDYYLAKSFLTDEETKNAKICIYNDPINSGGNEYADGYVDIKYSVCPKNHKIEVSRNERTS